MSLSKASGRKKWKLAVWASHPIQYQVPLYRRLAAHPEIDLFVYFQTDTGLRKKTIVGYGDAIRWDIPLLEGYAYKILVNVSPISGTLKPWANINPTIVRELLKTRYDGILINGYSSVSDWLGFAAASVLRVPILFRGEVLVNSARRLISSRRCGDYFRRFWCRQLGAALAVSSGAKEYFAHYGVPATRVFWAPLAVDNEYWHRRADELRPEREEIRASLGIPPDRPVLLLVAHLRDQKRPMDLLEAAARLKSRASLVVVGAGPLWDQVRQYRESRGLSSVYLVGEKNQTELPQYYAAADIFVMTSGVGEINPLVVHEAMCFGLPLIMSDAIPSSADVILEAQNGYTYPVGNISELVERIERLLDNPTRRSEMGQCSRDLNSSWNYDVCVKGIVEALGYLTDHKKE